MDVKMCTKCRSEQSVDNYWVRRKAGEIVGLQAWCKTCVKAQRKAWADNNKGRVAVHDRHKSLRARYGEDAVERYDLLYEMQKGCCAICGEPETIVDSAGRKYRLAVDHDHATNEVRGLLCRPCNQTLGKMGDDIEGVRRWLRYLEETPNSHLPEVIDVPARWAHRHPACVECSTTVVPHGGNGLCRNCYMRNARREGKPWVKDVPWSVRKERGALSPSRRTPKG